MCLKQFSGLDYDYSIKSLNSVMKKLCGDLYIDMYNQKFLPEHFYDGTHNTDRGSKLIGNLIADFYRKDFLINDTIDFKYHMINCY